MKDAYDAEADKCKIAAFHDNQTALSVLWNDLFKFGISVSYDPSQMVKKPDPPVVKPVVPVKPDDPVVPVKPVVVPPVVKPPVVKSDCRYRGTPDC